MSETEKPSVEGVWIFSETTHCKQSGELEWCKDGLGCIPGLCVIWIEFISEEDSCSYLRNQTVAKKTQKNSGLNGIRTHDLCNASAVLY